MPIKEYYMMRKTLNAEQLKNFLYNCAWCKRAVKKIKEGKTPEAYRMFLSGPGVLERVM